jgi:uncharacterized membrane protein
MGKTHGAGSCAMERRIVMFRLLVVIILCLALFTGFVYYNMSKQADRFMTRIQREVLELFDRRAGLDPVKEAVQQIADEENIAIQPRDISVQIVPTTSSHAAAAVGMAAVDSAGEAIEVTVDFTVEQYLFSRTFTRKAAKQLKGMPAGGSSHSAGGFTGGVNLSHPTRDVHSHRQSVDRAVRGKNP